MDAINWNALLSVTKKKKKKRVKRRTVSNSSSSNNVPTGGTGAPQVTNGQFVFPMTFTTKPRSPTKSPSKHESYLTAGTISPEEIKRRIQAFIGSFFIEHKGKALNVTDFTDKESAVNILQFMKPLTSVKGEIGRHIAQGGFGDTYYHSDPNKIIKVIDIYGGTYHAFSADPSDIIAELLIQYILQLDTEYPNMVPTIYDIYYDKTKAAIWIIMEKMDKTLDQVFNEELGTISLRTFRGYIKQILEMLVYLNKTYGFVHRDLKPKNIMVKAETVIKRTLRGKNKEEIVNKVRLIDFGFSVMILEGIKLGSTFYFKNESPCRGRQDTTYLFGELNTMRGKFDTKVQDFLDEILTPIGKPVRGLMNFNGKLLSCPSTRILDPAKALRTLENTV
jgi:hypothetical protein